jgi:hypothetical protein
MARTEETTGKCNGSSRYGGGWSIGLLSMVSVYRNIKFLHLQDFCKGGEEEKAQTMIIVMSSSNICGNVVGWGTTLQAGRSRVRSQWGHWIFFNWPNPSSCTMALGSTQPLTEMSTRNLPGSKGRLTCGANNLTRHLSRKCGSHKISQLYWPSQPVTGIVLLYFYKLKHNAKCITLEAASLYQLPKSASTMLGVKTWCWTMFCMERTGPRQN